MTGAPLTEVERNVVELLDEGYARWKVAEMLGLGDTTVRGVIKRLCDRYQCTMRQLPERVRQEQAAEDDEGGAWLPSDDADN